MLFDSVTSAVYPFAIPSIPIILSTVFCTASSFMSHTATLIPDFASVTAVSLPIYPPAHVIKALYSSFKLLSMLSMTASASTFAPFSLK